MDEAPWSRFKAEVYALLGRNPRSNRMVVRTARLEPDEVVLDIGCGPGAAVRGAARHVAKAIGVDRSQPMIDIARRRSVRLDNVEYHVAGAEDLPLTTDSIDVAWTIHAYHHWEHPEAGIAEVLRVLRSGGRLLIVETETESAHGLTRTDAVDVAQRLESAGFSTTQLAKLHNQLIVTGHTG